MKQRLLSFVAIAALSCVAMAQSWTAPVEPVSPANILLENAATVESGSAYYIMNIGAGQFITGANDWATEISLSSDATPYVQILVEEIAQGSTVAGTKGTANTAMGDGFTFKLNGQFLFNGSHGSTVRTNHAVSNSYLFRDAANGYVDMNNQNKGFVWKLTESDNGYYIQTIEEDTNFPNAAEEYAGSAGVGNPVKFNCTIEDANIEWVFIPVDAINIDDYKTLVNDYTTKVAIYKARLALYNTLLDAAKFGVDYNEASAVYNNPDATAEQLTTVKEALQPAVNKAVLLAAIASSSEDTPYDVTQYVLKNPSFDEGMTGWTITEGMGQNLQVQPKHYPENNPEAESFIENFIEAWRVSTVGPLSDGVICQTVTGLPEGRYRIEADVMAVWQGATLSEDPKGIYLFYNNGKFTLHSESLSTGNGVPDHFIFDFDYDGAAEMTIGLMAENTNQNWMGFDNLKLFAIGEVQTPPSFYALRTEVETSEPYNDEGDDLKANAGLRTSFQNAFSAAYKLADDQNPTKEKAESYEQAYQALHDARLALAASIADYNRLNDLINRIQSDYESYEGQSMYADLRTQLNSMISEYQGGYENGSYTSGEIDGFITAYDNVLKDYVQALFDNAAKDAAEKGTTLEEPINITSLFDHMSYAYGTTQTGENVYANGYPAENPVWINETKAKNFQTNYSTAQVWNQHPFKISRTFNELPAGRYEIRVHGAYRMAAHDVNYPAYTNGEYAGNDGAFLFAGSNKTPFINMAEITTSAPIVEGNDANVGTDEAPIYVINGQQAAHMLFSDAAYAALAEKCYLAVATNVKNGTLTVGVEGTDQLQDNQWTVWQDFELYYYGAPNASALDDEIQALIDIAEPIAQDKGEGDAIIVVQSILNDLSSAVKDGQDALASELEKDKQAAIKTLEDAIAAARENMSVFTEMMALYESRATAMENLTEYSFEDTTYPELLNEVIQRLDGIFYDEELQENVSFDSQEQMVTYLNRMKDEWYTYLFSVQGMDQATEDEPIDLSYLITNATFDDMTGATKADPQGWTCEYESKDGGGREGVAEFWNASAFNIYQEIPTLKDGYWRLSVDAVYRAGNAAEEAKDDNGNYKNDEYLYANDLTTKIIQWSDTKRGAIIPENPETYTPIQQLYTQDGVQFDAPNSQANFLQFIEKSRYHNVLIFGYGEGIEGAFTGSITIGLKKTVAVANDWCPFDNFKLEYLGTEKPTAVESLGTKAAAGAAISSIFSIDGRQQSQLRRGINIVRTADGKVTKVLVK